MKRSMLITASLLILGAAAAPTWALSPQTDAQFCRAIGLEPEQRPTCTQQMMDAATLEDKDVIAAKWVAISPLASNSPTSLYKPPVDDNAKNGLPATHYKDKVRVSNEVAAQIYRAMEANRLNTTNFEF